MVSMILIYSKQFKKDIKKLPKALQKKTIERIDLLLQDPNHTLLNNHWLSPPWDGYKSINITGDIRLVYQQRDYTYTLARIGSHSELYS